MTSRRLQRRSLAIFALLLLPGSGCSEPATVASSADRPQDPIEQPQRMDTPASDILVEVEVIGASGGAQRTFPQKGPILLRLTLRNPSEQPVALAFSSGKKYDAVLLGEDGRELWRWSDGRMFMQALSQLQLEPGSESSFELVCDPKAEGKAPLPTGTYRAEGVIPAFGNELRSRVVELEIE